MGRKDSKQKAVLIAHEAFVFEEDLVEDRTVVCYLVVFHIDEDSLPDQSAPLGPVGVGYHSHAFPVSPLCELDCRLKIRFADMRKVFAVEFSDGLQAAWA